LPEQAGVSLKRAALLRSRRSGVQSLEAAFGGRGPDGDDGRPAEEALEGLDVDDSDNTQAVYKEEQER
jgi:hypothetical protein